MTKRHPAVRLEDALNERLARLLAARGWVRRMLPFTGYGGGDFARCFARVVMSRPQGEDTGEGERLPVRRGIRMFFAAPVPDVPVIVRVGGAQIEAVSDLGGYLDVTLHGHGLSTGWHEAEFELDGEISTAPIQIIDDAVELGIVSDIDDTCLITMLPRPLLAAYNSFVLRETARRVVPGMAAMYRSLLAHHPGTPVIYLSTGAWNTQPTLTRFLRRHGYPSGALLLTDWGPTETSWFRSGRQHKVGQLQRLMAEFPRTRWLLVGDDGQHDPSIYSEVARDHPDQVAAIAIRHLTPAQQLLSSGSPLAHSESGAHEAEVVTGPDGYVLHRLVTHALRAWRRESVGADA